MRYRTIVADPPWKYGTGKFDTSGAERTKSSAQLRYDTMTIDDIAGLPVGDMAEDDAHLWLWGTNMKLGLAYQVVEAWGFEPITLLIWCKKQSGVGQYLRNNTEHCILASRGKPQPPETKPISTWFVWPRGQHSAKPDAFYDLVEQVSPGPYVELFARRARFGWDYWGDQSLGTAEMKDVADERT